IESISDSAILENKSANRSAKQQLGISGRENRSGNDGSITRFGWKAQNKSLVMFAGEAYNVEQGITNELFPNERSQAPGCRFMADPEDGTDFDAASPAGFQRPGHVCSVHALPGAPQLQPPIHQASSMDATCSHRL